MPSAQCELYLNGTALARTATLAAAGVAAGDLLLLRRRAADAAQLASALAQSLASLMGGGGGQSAQTAATGDGDARAFRQQVLQSPALRAQLAQNNPPLLEAVERNDLATIGRVLREAQAQRAARQRELDALQADPLNPESQRRIEELIRQSAVEENMNNAMEYNPAAFGRVTMLYVDCAVNNVPIKAFVDSGAQSTIMSQAYVAPTLLHALLAADSSPLLIAAQNGAPLQHHALD